MTSEEVRGGMSSRDTVPFLIWDLVTGNGAHLAPPSPAGFDQIGVSPDDHDCRICPLFFWKWSLFEIFENFTDRGKKDKTNIVSNIDFDFTERIVSNTLSPNNFANTVSWFDWLKTLHASWKYCSTFSFLFIAESRSFTTLTLSHIPPETPGLWLV